MRTKWIAAGLAGLLAAVLSPPARAACEKPVYVIAHRCNTLGTDANGNALGPAAVVDVQKVNAIEADFTYGRKFAEDKAWYVEHDDWDDPLDTHPIFAWSTKLDDWLEDTKKVVGPHSPLALIIFDIKAPEGPLKELYHAARAKLGPDINLLFSIGNYEKRGHFYTSGLADLINADPRAGVAIDMLDDGEYQWMVQDFFRGSAWLSVPPIVKYWFGDGICAGCVMPDRVEMNVADGITLRDASCDTLHGVYTWTYENESSIKDFLDDGVDGIMVNASNCYGRASPATAWDARDAVAHAKTLSGRKFATPADNPFERPLEQLVCPQDAVVECIRPRGAFITDPPVAAFLDGVTSSVCEPVAPRTHNAPYYLDLKRHGVQFTEFGRCGVRTCQAHITVQDTQPPKLESCGRIEVRPDNPYGMVVNYPVTATDTCDPSPSLVCDPPSGTRFGVGTRMFVLCQAADESGRQSRCLLEVKILSAAEMTGLLRAEVVSAPALAHGERTSLTSQVDALLDKIAKGNRQAACAHVKNFLGMVAKAITAGSLAPAEGQPMTEIATDLRNTLACSK